MPPRKQDYGGENLTKEHIIQNEIRLALSPYAVIFRGNVGSGLTYDGRHFSTGLPKGFPDLFGFRKSDGKIIFIEVKTPNGRVRTEQKDFLEIVRKFDVIAGVCRSPKEALRLLGVSGYE